MVTILIYLLLGIIQVFAQQGTVTYDGEEYDSSSDTTKFSYGVVAVEDFTEWTLDIPKCEEVSVVDVSPDFNQGQVKGSTASYVVVVSGFVKTGTISYTIGDSAESKNIAGPICERIIPISCDAGGPYHGSCGGRVALSDSRSQHMSSSTWSTNENSVSFSSTTAHNPILMLSNQMCDSIIIVTLTITGKEDQIESCEARVIVVDNDPPVLSGLYAVDTTVECNDVPAPSVVSAKDNCDDDVGVLFIETKSLSGGGMYTIIRTWTATDFCSQSVSYTQSINVVDEQAPTLIGVPDDEAFECSQVPPPCTVWASDNCDDDSLAVQYDQQIQQGTCNEAQRRIRTWSVTDSSGMTTSQKQTLTMSDTEGPHFLGLPNDLIVSCGEIPELPTVTAQDNCDPDVKVLFSETTEDNLSLYDYTLVFTYTSTDDCGNTNSVSWRVSVHDSSAPEMHGVDDDQHVNCDEVPEPCEVIVTDNCDVKLEADFSEKVTDGSCPNEYIVVRSWIAVDTSGNGASNIQTIYVSDTSAPKFRSAIPNVLKVNCDFIPTENVEAVDNCGSVDLLLTEETISGTSSVHYSLSRKWTATDDCGNKNELSQMVEVTDDQIPMLSGLPAASFDLACDTELVPSSVVAIDNCPECNVDLVTTETTESGTCDNEARIVRKWIATDCGGNTASFQQIINMVDTEAPKMTGLFGHIVVSVGNVPDVNNVEATDNCQVVTPVFNEETISGSCLDNYVVVRSWTAADDCGNSNVHHQSIQVIDNEPPSFSIPEDITVNCHSIPTDNPTGSDNSGRHVDIEVQELRIDGDSCSSNYKLVRTFTAQDACSNSAILDYTISVVDTEAPVWNEIPDSYTHVSERPGTPELSASDNCQDITVQFEENVVSHECSTQSTIYYTWNAADDCGNAAAQITQTVDVIDIEPPVFSGLPEANIFVDCAEIPSKPAVTASDSGDSVEVEFNEVVGEYDCSETYLILRTWTAFDCVRNSVFFVQTIHVTDTNPPSLSIPEDTDVSCSDIPVVNLDEITANDDCHPVISLQLHESKLDEVTSNDYFLTRSWVAMDSCGNAATETQILVVSDKEIPEIFGVPLDITVSCDLPNAANPSCSDNCDDELESPTFSESPISTEEGCNDYTVTRTWVCTDKSGNNEISTQQIYVHDSTVPTFGHPYPSAITAECHTIPDAPVVTATDECDDDLSIQLSEAKSQITSDANYLLVRTWTTTDHCGNSDSIQQSVTVRDTEIPVVENIPSPHQISCPNVPTTPGGVSVFDNCDDAPGLSTSQERNNGDCEDRYSIEYFWIPTDASGNVGSTASVIVTVDDNKPPTFNDDVESPITVSYTAIPVKLSLEAHDECDPDVQVTCSRDTTTKECKHEKTIVDTCVATDRCGNSVSVNRVLNVVDDVPPPLSLTPTDTTIECPGNLPEVPQVVSEIGVAVHFSESEAVRSCAYGYTLLRTWIAKDCALNAVSHTQTIVVQDTQPPDLSGVGSDQTIECSSEVPSSSVTASDACDSHIHVDMSESIHSYLSDSHYDLIRKWVATDTCGQSSEDQQTISIRDTASPHFTSLPENSVVDYVDIVAPSVTCSDACSIPTVVLQEATVSGTCTYHYSVVRTWTCSDPSQNSVTAERTVVVSDTKPPTLSETPSNVIVEVGHIPDVPSVVATDNIDPVVPVDFAQVRIDGLSVNDFKLIRTWTATDDCNNVAQHSQTIKVIDVTPPIIPQVPPNMATGCEYPPSVQEDELLTLLIEAQVADVDVAIQFKRTRFDGDCPNTYLILREWIATDGSGNAISDKQEIQVSDFTSPTFDNPGVPASVTADCANIPAAADVRATDTCGGSNDGSGSSSVDVVLSETRVDGQHIHEYLLIRTWTATDACGLTVENHQEVFVKDSLPPALSHNPADETISCTQVNSLDIPEITATDNCAIDLIVVYTETQGPVTCQMTYSIHRTWKITDTAGFVVSYTQTISVVDLGKPTINNPPSHLTVDCVEATPEIPSLQDLDVHDDCVNEDQIQKAIDQVTFVNGDIRNWYATDPCGNQAHYAQTITIIDDTKPTFSDITSSATAECDNIPVTPSRGAEDNCDISPTVVESSLRSDGSCASTYAVVTTWIATDSSGNTANTFYTVNVVDTTAPILSEIPSMLDITVSCHNIPTAPTATAHDNCDDEADIEYSQDTLSGTETDQYRLTRTWKAEDECGNTAQTIQTIHVLKDTELPVFTNVPQDQEVTCRTISSSNPPSVSDNCDSSLNLEFKETHTAGTCSNEWTLIRSWVVSDSSGNVASVAQTLHVVDTQPPSFITPENIDVSCDAVPEPETLSVTDDCDQLTEIKMEETRTDSEDSKDRYTLVRTWTATDECGNSISKSQHIQVDDTSKPKFVNLPSSTEKSCENVDSSDPSVEATDNCDSEVSITHTSTSIDYTCIFHYKLVHTWVAKDRSGNSRTATQTISISDNTPPVFGDASGKQDISVACDEVPSQEMMDATDNCETDLSVTMSEDTTFKFPNFIKVRVWSTSDDCGNQVEHIQTVTVLDTNAPVITGILDDITLECGNSIPYHFARANDICDPDTSVTMEEETTPGSCLDTSSIVYTWSSNDISGNTATATAIVTIQDTLPPVFNEFPISKMTYECDDIQSAILLTATDNCDGDVTVDFLETHSNTLTVTEYQISRSWTAIDRCGNSAEETQLIDVDDTQAPTLTCNSCDELFVGCDHLPNAPTVSVNDNCDTSVSIEFSEKREDGSCNYAYELTRSWSAIDHAGNIVSINQLIHVIDNVAPVLIGVPADEMRECDNLSEAPTVTTTDNCDDTVVVVMTESESDRTSKYEYSIARVWTVTDSCGQTVVEAQTTQVVDTKAPTLSKQPISVSVEVDEVKGTWPGKITATDNCDQEVSVEFTQKKVPGSCHYAYILIRNWKSVDTSGNVAEHSQTVGLNDFTPPLLIGVPDDTVVDYEQQNTIPSLSSVLENVKASDNSGAIIQVSGTETKIEEDCGSTFRWIRTFLAEDACGNAVSASQTIHIVDHSPPLLSAPSDETVECDAIPEKCRVEVLANPDHPDYGLSVSFNEETIGNSASYHYQLVRTWWADDCAGNQASHSQTVTVKDITPPVLSRLPQDHTSECVCEDSQGVDVESIDNCDDNPVVNMEEVKVSDENSSPDSFVLYRTWHAADLSGNSEEYTQTLTVSDSVPPQFCEDSPAPVNSFVQCDSVPPTPDLKFNDNCDPNVDVQYSEQKKNGDCSNTYSLIRTWTATDRTGNSKVHTQTIEVSDDAEPELLTDNMLCLFPANGKIAVYEQVTERLIEAVDNCGDVTVRLQSCNSTQPESEKPAAFPADCAYDSNADTLYVRIERNEHVSAGRFYRLWVAISDKCGNQKLAKKVFWVPYDQASFDAEDTCDGTGADHFVSSLPDF